MDLFYNKNGFVEPFNHVLKMLKNTRDIIIVLLLAAIFSQLFVVIWWLKNTDEDINQSTLTIVDLQDDINGVLMRGFNSIQL